MNKCLAISIRFLSDRYHGRTQNGHAPEWPPSPLRVFQALIAGVAPRWRDDGRMEVEEIAAFRWLERQEPPVIFAPSAKPGQVLLTYVRENLSDIAPEKRDAKLHRPTLMEGDPSLTYFWPIADREDERRFAAIIAGCAKHIRALGWGIDMAVGFGVLVDGVMTKDSLRECWTPSAATDGCHLRIAIEGTLEDLRARHAASLNRIDSSGRNPVPPLSAYSMVTYRCGSGSAPRAFAAFLLRPYINPAIAEQDTPEGTAERRKADQFHAFRTSNAAKVAAMLRHAACEAVEEPDKWPSSFVENSARYVAGHGERTTRRTPDDGSPRFSYLALPSIGGPHADGMIRRVIVAEPFGGDGEHAAWAERTLAGLSLVDEDTGQPVATLERARPSDASERKMLDRFIGPSRDWVTVTPIVLPGFDGLKMEKAARLFSRACDQAGLPPGSVESFEFIGPPARDGGGRFFLPSYLRGLPLRWVIVRFKNEVRGPIAIGAGRHCGLGVFAVESTA